MASRKRREEALRRLLQTEQAGSLAGRSFFSAASLVERREEHYVFTGDVDALIDRLVVPAPSSAQKPLWW